MKNRIHAFLHIAGNYRAAFLSWAILFLILTHLAAIAHADEVTLSWDPNTEPDLAGYKVHAGFETGNYIYHIDVGNVTTYTISSDLMDDRSVYFTLTAYDANGNESDYSKEVIFNAANHSPTADAGPDQTVDEWASVTLSGVNSTDPEGRALSYFWEQTSGSSVDISNPTSAQAGFKAPDVGIDGESLVFRLRVTDDTGLKAEDYCVVNVLFVNRPPTANAGSDLTVVEGEQVVLEGTGSSDPDDGIVAVYWLQISGPPVTILNPTQATTTFNAPQVTSEGVSLMFELGVRDAGGLISRDTCVVNVTSLNMPPTASAGPDQTVYAKDTVRLYGSGSTDPDDGIAAFRWTQTGGTAVTLSDPTASTPTFTAPAVTNSQTLTFQLTVTDAAGLASQDVCSVIVNPTTQESATPTLNITANNSEGSVRVFRRQAVSISISVDPIDLATQRADLWLIVDAPNGRYYYVEGFGWHDQPTPYAQKAIDGGFSKKAFNSKLPVGSYTFTFAIDNNSDGRLDRTWTDTVSVKVW